MTSAPAKRIDAGPNRGHYDVGGVLYPSISLLLDSMGSGFEYDEDDTFYLDRGTLTHLAMHAYLGGVITAGDLDGWLEAEVLRNGFDIDLRDVIPGAAHGIEWCRRYVRSVRRIEEPGVNIEGSIACTPDWDGADIEGLDGLALIDIKRQSSRTPLRKSLAQIAAQHHVQFVATANGPGEPYRDYRIAHFGNLCITPEGAYLRTYTPYQVEAAYRRCVLYLSMRHYHQRPDDGWCRQGQAYMETFLAMARVGFDEWQAESRRKIADPGYVGWGPWVGVPPRSASAKAPAAKPRLSAAQRRAQDEAARWGHSPAEVSAL